MKLFNAQSKTTTVEKTKLGNVVNADLSKKVVLDQSMLALVAGGSVNDGKIEWPVVRPK